MSKVFADIAVSLDGYVAGPNPSMKDPLGIGGMQLHEWAFRLQSWRKAHGQEGGEPGEESDLAQHTIDRYGAIIMGRKMFSGGSGPWESDDNKDGWWGDNPPFHVPVFILTSHARESVSKDGGTTFNFVTDGIESALAQAKTVAGSKDIQISGGANVIQQFMKADLLDELNIKLVPVLLGSGTKLFDNLDPGKLEKIEVRDFPLVTHIKYQLRE